MKAFKLKFESEIDEYQFLDVSFEVRVFLLDKATERLETRIGSDLSFELCYQDEKVHIPNQLLKIDPARPKIDPQTGVCTAKISVLALSQDHQGKKFQIKVSAINTEKSVESLFSKKFYVVRHKLVVLKNPVDTWYKDEGGKDSSIEFQVGLADYFGNIINNRQIQLAISIGYEDLKETFKADPGILTIMNPVSV